MHTWVELWDTNEIMKMDFYVRFPQRKDLAGIWTPLCLLKVLITILHPSVPDVQANLQSFLESIENTLKLPLPSKLNLFRER